MKNEVKEPVRKFNYVHAEIKLNINITKMKYSDACPK